MFGDVTDPGAYEMYIVEADQNYSLERLGWLMSVRVVPGGARFDFPFLSGFIGEFKVTEGYSAMGVERVGNPACDDSAG